MCWDQRVDYPQHAPVAHHPFTPSPLPPSPLLALPPPSGSSWSVRVQQSSKGCKRPTPSKESSAACLEVDPAEHSGSPQQAHARRPAWPTPTRHNVQGGHNRPHPPQPPPPLAAERLLSHGAQANRHVVLFRGSRRARGKRVPTPGSASPAQRSYHVSCLQGPEKKGPRVYTADVYRPGMGKEFASASTSSLRALMSCRAAPSLSMYALNSFSLPAGQVQRNRQHH